MQQALKWAAATLTASLFLGGCASTDPATPASAAVAAMTDAELAAKLKGEWTGTWSIGQYSGKFVLLINEAQGTSVKGEGHFYGTAKGDTKEALASAGVEKGQLIAKQASGMEFKLKLRNEKVLRGSWSAGGFVGDLDATRN